jgi:hypothetical protein
VWNAHGYLAAELRRHGIAFRTADNCIIDVADSAALQRFADHVTPQLVEHLILRWLRQVPDPLTHEERAAGYPLRFSIYQAEFSHNVIFKQTQVLNRVYEALLRDHLHLGRPDMLKVIFGRQIRRNTPSVYVTRILRQGVVTCLKVFYKHSWLNQYNKGGRVLRTEICINNPTKRKLWRWPQPWSAPRWSGSSLPPPTEGSASPESGSARLGRCGCWQLSGAPGSLSRRSRMPSSAPS